jgi:hypothetical protein
VRNLVGGALVLLAGVACSVAADKPDFSGKWKLVVEKSNFGRTEKPVSMTLVSTVEGEKMHSVQTTETSQGPQITEFTWYTDGKRHLSDKPTPGYSVTKWEDNVLVTDRRSNDGSYRETIRMTMSADGKTATEEVQIKNPSGTNKEKLVWEHQ